MRRCIDWKIATEHRTQPKISKREILYLRPYADIRLLNVRDYCILRIMHNNCNRLTRNWTRILKTFSKRSNSNETLNKLRSYTKNKDVRIPIFVARIIISALPWGRSMPSNYSNSLYREPSSSFAHKTRLPRSHQAYPCLSHSPWHTSCSFSLHVTLHHFSHQTESPIKPSPLRACPTQFLFIDLILSSCKNITVNILYFVIQ